MENQITLLSVNCRGSNNKEKLYDMDTHLVESMETVVKMIGVGKFI